jgi:hypothetical protein
MFEMEGIEAQSAGAPQWWRRLPGQTLLATGKIGLGEIGNAPIAAGRIVIEPIGFGSRALPGQRYPRTRSEAIELEKSGSVLVGQIRTASGPIEYDGLAHLG